MTAVFVGLASTINEFGLTSAIIQRRSLTDDEIQSAFWFNLGVGFAMFAIGWAAAEPVSRFYGQPMVASILPVSSSVFLIASISLVPNALLRRRMDFRHPALASVLAAVATLAASVILALLGAGVWALVVGSIGGAATSSTYLLLTSRWRPRLHCRWRELQPLVRFGGILTAASIVNFGSSNVDYLIVGRTLGSAPLGAYTLAYSLSSFPTSKLSQTVAATLAPAFAQVQDEPRTFRDAFIETVGYAAFPAAIVLATAAALSEDVILGLYGAKWGAAVGPFRVLCAAGFVTSVTTLMGLVFRGLNRPGKELIWSTAFLGGSVVGVTAGLAYGVTGVAIGITAGMLVTRIPAQLDANRLLHIAPRRYGTALLPAIAAAAVAAALSLGLRELLIVLGAPPLLRLFVAAPVSVAGAWLLLRATRLGGPARALEGFAGEVWRGVAAGRSAST